MQFKGRTVFAFVVLAMLAGCVLTLTFIQPSFFAQVSGVGKGSSSEEKATAGLSSKDLDKLSTTYALIQNKALTAVDREKVMNGAVNGMLAALDDPYTVYMDQEESKAFDENISSTFQGIGAEVTSEEGKVVIMSPIKGSPAEKAGLMTSDIIVSVNGEKLEGLTLTQAVMKIRGPKGTQAKLEILRKGSSEPIQVTVVRDNVDLETVFSEMLPGSIGKLEVTQFSTNTSARFKEELRALEAKGMKGLIIDVRHNPGGMLTAVVEMLDELVPKGKNIVQVEDRTGRKEATQSSGTTGKKYPITVLINKGSASASEILAGGLQEAVGSKLVGETTFGKGTVQVVFDKELGDGSNIKMTVYKWLTPNGKWIHKSGIAPDIAVDQPAYFKFSPLSKKSVLKQDAMNDDVKNAQLVLQGLGLSPDRTDGYFSEKTVVAVKAFQRLNNLPMTGEIDTETANKLEKAVVQEIRNPKNDAQLKAAVQYLESVIK